MIPLWNTAQPRKLRYILSTLWNIRSLQLKSLPCFLLSLLRGAGLSNTLESIGVRANAVKREVIRQVTVRTANCLNITPTIPPINTKGRNTTMVVRVDAAIANPISDAPNIAACLGIAPRSMCCVMFSSTTMALSTTIPIAITNATKENMLMV